MSTNEEVLLVQELTQQIKILKDEVAELKYIILNKESSILTREQLEIMEKKYVKKYPKATIYWDEIA